MGSFQIEGGRKLKGTLVPQGAKNEALQILCATLLTPEKVEIENLPEIVDVLKTDTISEMAQGKPTATPTFEEAVMYLYMALRNKLDVSGTIKEFHNDAGTIVWKKSLSDDGSTYTEAEGESG